MSVRMVPLFTMAIVVTTVVWGQGTASLRARELFYTPPPSVSTAVKPAAAATPAAPAPKRIARKSPEKQVPNQAPSQTQVVETPTQAVSTKPPAAVPLGIRYSILKRNDAGVYQEVDVDSTFHSGDRIRLEAQSNTTGYLYVVAQGSSGAWQVLFPSREVAGGSNQVHRGETRLVPGGNAGQFVFDEQPGTEKLFFVLSRQPEASLDKLIYSMGQTNTPTGPSNAEPAHVLLAQATVSDDVISRLRDQMVSRDLVFEKVDNEKVAADGGAPGAQAKMETAAYVVNPSTAPDARVVVDLKLKHE
jgi:hypothetical protein